MFIEVECTMNYTMVLLIMDISSNDSNCFFLL